MLHTDTEYEKTELTMSAGKVNIMALAVVVPVLILYAAAYYLAWPEQFALQNLKTVSQEHKTLIMYMPAIMVLVFVAGAAVHEWIHGFTWAAFCKNGLKSIKYGVHWKALTPYCHCKEVLPLHAYVLGGAMPGILMGVLPAVVGLISGSFLVFLFGLLFTLAAAGDILILWMLRHQKKEDFVQDHPHLIGCYILRKR